MHSRELVEVLTDDDAEVLEAHPLDALVNGRDELDARDRSPIGDTEAARRVGCDTSSMHRLLGNPSYTFSKVTGVAHPVPARTVPRSWAKVGTESGPIGFSEGECQMKRLFLAVVIALAVVSASPAMADPPATNKNTAS